jgi:hypothetical protein
MSLPQRDTPDVVVVGWWCSKLAFRWISRAKTATAPQYKALQSLLVGVLGTGGSYDHFAYWPPWLVFAELA